MPFDDTQRSRRRPAPSGTRDDWREDWSRLTGQEYRPEDWLGFVHEADRERIAAAFERMFKAGVFCEEYRLRGADGVFRWVTARVRRDRRGRWLGRIRLMETGDHSHVCSGAFCFCRALFGSVRVTNALAIAIAMLLLDLADFIC